MSIQPSGCKPFQGDRIAVMFLCITEMLTEETLYLLSQVLCHIPVVLRPGRLMQEDCTFEGSLGHVARLCLRNTHTHHLYLQTFEMYSKGTKHSIIDSEELVKLVLVPLL